MNRILLWLENRAARRHTCLIHDALITHDHSDLDPALTAGRRVILLNRRAHGWNVLVPHPTDPLVVYLRADQIATTQDLDRQ